MLNKLRERRRLAREAEDRQDRWRHARELAIWNSSDFQEWEKNFRKAFQANANAAFRATLRRGEPPIDRPIQ